MAGAGSTSASLRIGAALSFSGREALSGEALCRESGVPLAEIPEILRGMIDRADLVELPLAGGRVVRVPEEAVRDWEVRFKRALDRIHRAHPRHSAVRRGHLRSALADVEEDAMFDALIGRLIASGEVVSHEGRLALRSFEPLLSHAERSLKATLADALRRGRFSPPEDSELVARAGTRKNVVVDLLNLLVEEGRAVVVAPGLHLDADCERDIRRRARDFLADGRTMTVAELRDLLGTTRKYAVPLAEHLDRVGATVRRGDLRSLGHLDEGAHPHE